MSDKDIRDQLEGLFSDIVPEPEGEETDVSPLADAIVGPTQAEIDGAEIAKVEPVAVESLLDSPFIDLDVAAVEILEVENERVASHC